MSEANYPTIEAVCRAAAHVFVSEAPKWKVRNLRGDCRINLDEVMRGRGREQRGVSRIAADCRAICIHIIAQHVPIHNAMNLKDQLLTGQQIGLHMGGVTVQVIWHMRQRACKLLDKYQYHCMYYSVLKKLLDDGYDLWALPKDLTTQRA